MSDQVLIILEIDHKGDTKFLRSYISTNKFELIGQTRSKKDDTIKMCKGFEIKSSDSKKILDVCADNGLKDCIDVTDTGPNELGISEGCKYGFIITSVKTPTVYEMYATEKYDQPVTIDDDTITTEGFIEEYRSKQIRDKYEEVFTNVFNFFKGETDFEKADSDEDYNTDESESESEEGEGEESEEGDGEESEEGEGEEPEDKDLKSLANSMKELAEGLINTEAYDTLDTASVAQSDNSVKSQPTVSTSSQVNNLVDNATELLSTNLKTNSQNPKQLVPLTSKLEPRSKKRPPQILPSDTTSPTMPPPNVYQETIDKINKMWHKPIFQSSTKGGGFVDDVKTFVKSKQPELYHDPLFVGLNALTIENIKLLGTDTVGKQMCTAFLEYVTTDITLMTTFGDSEQTIQDINLAIFNKLNGKHTQLVELCKAFGGNTDQRQFGHINDLISYMRLIIQDILDEALGRENINLHPVVRKLFISHRRDRPSH